MHLVILVLGPLERSPRMLAHARAAAACGDRVELVGYVEPDGGPDAAGAQGTRIHPLRPPDGRLTRELPAVLDTARRLRRQAHELRRVLMGLGRPEAILVQCPPALPTLPVARRAARRLGARLVVDWHNFGADLLALRFGRGHPAVRAARSLEQRFGRRADAHLCVSEAMRSVLAAERGIPDAVVLRDAAGERFAPIAPELRRERLRALCAEWKVSTEAGLPRLVVSPSGWTEDEDHPLLLEALDHYDRAARKARQPAPTLLVATSGRGPLRDALLARARSHRWEHVVLRAPWLSGPRYAEFLASAELGISLHRSASGVDLPMKNAELRAAGVPILALDYGPCLREQLEPGRDALLFRDSQELGGLLATLFTTPTATPGAPSASLGVPATSTPTLAELARHARRPAPRWDEAWVERARPLLLGATA